MQNAIFQSKSVRWDLKQNSGAWFQHRKNFINASEIGTIMGFNPYEQPADLMRKKLFLQDYKGKFVENEAMKHGKITEPQASLFFSVLKGRNYIPINFTRDMFSASLDGYHEETNTLLEIKCPFNPQGASWRGFFQDRTIPKYYWAQVQCQLYCSQADRGYFLVFLNRANYHVVEVVLDQDFIVTMFQASTNFKKELAVFQDLYASTPK